MIRSSYSNIIQTPITRFDPKTRLTSVGSFFFFSVSSFESFAVLAGDRGVDGVCWQKRPSISSQSRAVVGESWCWRANIAQMLFLPKICGERKGRGWVRMSLRLKWRAYGAPRAKGNPEQRGGGGRVLPCCRGFCSS